MGRVAVIQMISSSLVADNLQQVEYWLKQAHEHQVDLVVLPENFAFMGMNEYDKFTIAEIDGRGPIQEKISQLARDLRLWIVAGTIPLKGNGDRVRAASLLFDNKGKQVARYDKIHLFDVEIPEKNERYSESHTTNAGSDIMVVDTPLGKLGLAVCYDIRFPELFRMMHLQKVEIIAYPAAFTFTTGSAHWDILVRARAIENQVYMIAAAQTGIHSNTRRTYGHSMIVNPWGKILAILEAHEGIVVADIDLHYMHQLRGDFPALRHRKLNNT